MKPVKELSLGRHGVIICLEHLYSAPFHILVVSRGIELVPRKAERHFSLCHFEYVLSTISLKDDPSPPLCNYLEDTLTHSL